MKEIKAYIRPSMVEKVISALEIAGVPGMTIIDVSTLGKWIDPERSRLSIEYCERYCSSVKVELVCSDNELEKFVNIIVEKAHTGSKGDGKIFVSDISDTISIRTKRHGTQAI